jgi:polysaccharide pyruvyl transferase WcaK-like protein
MADASHNKGEEAVLSVILDVLRPLCRRITVLDSDPALVRERHGVEALSGSQSRFPAVHRAIKEADLAVWAGGHMAQDISSQWSIFGRLWKPILAKWMRRRALIYAVDVGPLRTRLGRAVSRHFFARQLGADDLLIVRNEESSQLLRELGVDPARIHQTADPALSWTAIDREAARRAMTEAGVPPGRPTLAFCPRATFYMHSGFLPASVRLRLFRNVGQAQQKTRAYQVSMARTIDRVIEWLDAQVVLVPMDTAPNPRDDRLCAGVAEHVQHRDRVCVLGERLGLAATYGLMAEADLAVSGRFHGAVFALVGSTPVVPLETGQHKTERLMRRMGYPRPLLGVSDLADDPTGERLFAEVQAIWERRDEERDRIRERVAVCRAQWEATAAFVRDALTR